MIESCMPKLAYSFLYHSMQKSCQQRVFCMANQKKGIVMDSIKSIVEKLPFPWNQKTKTYCVIGVLALVLIISGGFLVGHFAGQKKGEEAYENLRDGVKTVSQNSGAQGEEPEVTIDFEKLQEINPDIYAWVEIPGTDVDYPIAQSGEDDAYYLTHSAQKAEDQVGCLYTERANSKDFTDFNTIIYGHNLKTGAMFGQLHDFADKAYLEEHSLVYIYLPEKTLRYRIFAATELDDRHILNSYNFTEESGRDAYLQDLRDSRTMEFTYDDSAGADGDSNLITLSTCVNGIVEKRWLIVAVLEE